MGDRQVRGKVFFATPSLDMAHLEELESLFGIPRHHKWPPRLNVTPRGLWDEFVDPNAHGKPPTWSMASRSPWIWQQPSQDSLSWTLATWAHGSRLYIVGSSQRQIRRWARRWMYCIILCLIGKIRRLKANILLLGNIWAWANGLGSLRDILRYFA